MADDDYMSDKFAVDLAPAVSTTRVSRKAGLKRKREPPPQLLSKKAIGTLMEEKREEGLNTKIDSSNPGFKLLQKMGYKGGGLGKERKGEEVPIMPEIKLGRGGIGRDAELRRTQELEKVMKMRMEVERKRTQEVHQVDYRKSMMAAYENRRINSDLGKARRAVETCDSLAELVRSPLWPDEPEKRTEDAMYSSSRLEAEVAKASEEAEKVELEAAAGGQASGLKEDGSISDAGGGKEGGEEAEGEGLAAMWARLDDADRLQFCLSYLRDYYHYCIYCGISYDSEEELLKECPGITYQDHED